MTETERKAVRATLEHELHVAERPVSVQFLARKEAVCSRLALSIMTDYYAEKKGAVHAVKSLAGRMISEDGSCRYRTLLAREDQVEDKKKDFDKPETVSEVIYALDTHKDTDIYNLLVANILDASNTDDEKGKSVELGADDGQDGGETKICGIANPKANRMRAEKQRADEARGRTSVESPKKSGAFFRPPPTNPKKATTASTTTSKPLGKITEAFLPSPKKNKNKGKSPSKSPEDVKQAPPQTADEEPDSPIFKKRPSRRILDDDVDDAVQADKGDHRKSKTPETTEKPTTSDSTRRVRLTFDEDDDEEEKAISVPSRRKEASAPKKSPRKSVEDMDIYSTGADEEDDGADVEMTESTAGSSAKQPPKKRKKKMGDRSQTKLTTFTRQSPSKDEKENQANSASASQDAGENEVDDDGFILSRAPKPTLTRAIEAKKPATKTPEAKKLEANVASKKEARSVPKGQAKMTSFFTKT